MGRLQRKLGKQIGVVGLLLTVGGAGCLPMTTAEALSPLAILGKGAVSYVVVRDHLATMDEKGQAESLKKTQERTGYLHNAGYQQRLHRIVKRLQDTPVVTRSYATYVNPEEDYNAFMTIGAVMSVNKGAMDRLDDDELAYVLGHEMGHGEHRDVVHGVEKRIGLETALSIATQGANEAMSVLGNVAGNFVENEMFTMSQEKRADAFGYEAYTAAGFNPGAAASAMASLRDEYGDLYREGLAKIVSPNNHPKSQQRVDDNVERMYKYSHKHVQVKKGSVYVNGQDIYAPQKAGRYTGERRAYLMAGKLAAWFHDHPNASGMVTTQGTQVWLDGKNIVTTASGTEAKSVQQKLQKALPAKK